MTPADFAHDDATRAAVKNELDATLFIEAGAGSGKTSCLVARFIALVEAGVSADRIAAITFTEKAAGELVDRIRSELQRRGESNSQCREALGVLDNAAIGTLHSFAQRILTEHPIEAGLPPRFGVTDEIASQLSFDARWQRHADAMLEEPELDLPLRLLFASGGKPKHLRDVAVAFNANWDLVVDRAGQPPPAVPPVDVADILDSLRDVLALAEHCTDEDDRLFVQLTGRVAQFESRLRGAVEHDARLGLVSGIKLKSGRGQKNNWPTIDIDDVRERLAELEAACESLRTGVLQGVLQVIASSLAQFTAASAESRRCDGELEFHDLLVLARNMLRDEHTGVVVRHALAQRYQRLLLDEFQDTDPIQIEIAVLIASSDPDAATKQWSEINIEPGRLFFVGDPKQSIYRFRRADVGMFMKARDQLVGSSKQLSRNFRTGRPIAEWVNITFAEMFEPAQNSQPEYQPLLPVRDGPDVGPSVAFFGREHDGKPTADQLRREEAADVSATIRRAIGEGWSVAERVHGQADRWRPARWSDIAVLLPARTSLPHLERALDVDGIPYRAETSSLVYGTREIRDLMMVARAVDDPTDSLSVVSALRTTAFACGDDDLFVWRKGYGGSWDHQNPAPDAAPTDHPVAQGMAWLGGIHRQRYWLEPSEILERILRERRFFELAAAQSRPRDLWRRLRFVLDQCRAWEEAGGRTLRAYLQWVEGQSSEGTRVVETVLPESDDVAVRILTVHGAKGLEFPVVILSGLTTAMNSQARRVEVRFPPSDGWAIKLSKRMSTNDFETYQPVDEQMGRHERIRLLYVAATRACDHLAVSVHRKARKVSEAQTSAEMMFDKGWIPERVEVLDLSDAPPAAVGNASREGDCPTVPTLAEWQSAHNAALASSSKPVAMSATRLASQAAGQPAAIEDPGLVKGPRDIDLPPWQKGRYGSAIGRAVHGVLQTVDLAAGAGLGAACAAQAAAEGVLGKEDVIESLARAALRSETVRAAAERRHWREVYVGIPYDNGIFEGYIDLLYEDDGGLVIVDYKTDAWRSDVELDEKVDRYSVQLRAYADAVRDAVGREVSRAALLFLRRNGSVLRAVDLRP